MLRRYGICGSRLFVVAAAYQADNPFSLGCPVTDRDNLLTEKNRSIVRTK